MKAANQIAVEREATLVIVSDVPEVVYREIASLTAVGAYELLPEEPQILEDYYFDTPDGALKERKWGLRLRQIGTEIWIAIKGPSQTTLWGGRERREIEALWSENALDGIAAELSRNGVRLNFSFGRPDSSEPFKAMRSAGLIVVQRRDTRRCANAVISRADDCVQAELDADLVTYYFSQGEIRHHEVEIETKGNKGAEAAETVVDHLLSTYGPQLRRWHHDKLATGWAIGELLSTALFVGLRAPDGTLTPTAYDMIDQYLGREIS